MESIVESLLQRTAFRDNKRPFGRTMAVGIFTAISLVAIISGSTAATAQDLQALVDRIDRLERDIRTLNIQLARGDSTVSSESGESSIITGGTGMTGSAIAQFDARIASIEDDVRTTTGTIENLDFRIRTIEGQLEKIVSDIEFRLSAIEQGQGLSMSQNAGQALTAVPSASPVTQDVGQTASAVLGSITETELQQISSTEQTTFNGDTTQSATPSAAGTATATESSASVQGVTTQPVEEIIAPASTQEAALSPKEQYTYAFGLLRQAKYDEAATALQVFIEQNPEDPLAPNARYWLGETFYVRSEFVHAAEVFFEGYRLAPTAQKAPDTLLKLGMALGNLGKKPEACAAFGKLADEFPNASANVRTTLERERLRNGC